MKSQFTLIASVLIIILSCTEEDPKISTYTIKGLAQKGPFVAGADVSVSELDKNLKPTGNIFFSTVQNDNGYFEIPNVKLASSFVEVKVEGLYFHEEYGTIVSTELTLYAISDLSQDQEINVNLLTHLERGRVKYLVQENGVSFKDAKEQTFSEILNFFSWDDSGSDDSEALNLVEDNQGGAVLLAVSSIIGHLMYDGDPNDYSAWLALLVNFNSDLADNGVIDSEAIQNKFLTTATILDIDRIKQNFEDRYGEINLPDFESLLNYFINNSPYKNYFEGLFPETSEGFINILTLAPNTILDPNAQYAIIVNPPEEDLIFYIGVTINFSPDVESTFNATSNQWDYIGENNAYISLNRDNKFDVLIPISFTGNGSLDIEATKTVDRIYGAENIFHRINW
jgi:hypothetical protein